jgi:thiamine transport system substrate-binding protein
MKRRQFLGSAAGLAGAAGLSGCIAGTFGGQGDDLSGTLRVATYSSFVDAPSSSPGPWLKEHFEEEFPEATLEWKTPENEVNYYVERASRGVDLDADVYVGLNVDHLIRVDEKLEDPLFEPTADVLENYEHVKEDLVFDPENRAIPYDTGYISLVYDENEVENPGTFDALTTEEYRGDLIVQNAQTAATGRAFLLWTIHEKGEDAYLDYWRDLADNDVRILGTWDDAYAAYSDGEAPMVVSYSTDQVFANRYEEDMSRHQVGFLNDQGYANPEGMAKFAGTDNDALAESFLDFVLRAEVQSEIAVRNVQFPAVDNAELDEEFEKYAHEPPEPVTFTYEELAGNVDGWVEAWAREIAGQ